MAAASERERQGKRLANAESVLKTVNNSLGTSFSLDQWKLDEAPPVVPALAERMERSTGLVAAYISEPVAVRLLEGFVEVLGVEISAKLWMDEQAYMGMVTVDRLRLSRLAELAKTLEDRIYVHPVNTDGLIIVDFYALRWNPEDIDFSILVQGPDLESRLRCVFPPREAEPAGTRPAGQRAMTKSWPELVAHYRKYQGDWGSIYALQSLAQRINGTPLAGGLFAWTSMFDLCIVQTEVSYPYDGPLLRLSPVSKDQVEFRYEDTHLKTRQWHRTVDAGDVMQRLLGFLEQLHWVPSAVLESKDFSPRSL